MSAICFSLPVTQYFTTDLADQRQSRQQTAHQRRVALVYGVPQQRCLGWEPVFKGRSCEWFALLVFLLLSGLLWLSDGSRPPGEWTHLPLPGVRPRDWNLCLSSRSPSSASIRLHRLTLLVHGSAVFLQSIVQQPLLPQSRLGNLCVPLFFGFALL